MTKRSDYNKAYQEAHREYLKEYRREWARANKERLDLDRKLRLRSMQNNPRDKRHGTYTGYVTGCRCGDCKAAATRYHCDYRARLKEELEADPDHRLHGKAAGVQAGCRCDKCKEARRKK